MIFGAPQGFRRARTGAVELHLDATEADVLAGLLEQLDELVQPARKPPADAGSAGDPLADLVDIDSESRAPSDPAVLRLFPDGYREDPEAAADFRRFTERGLRRGKLERIGAVQGVLQNLAGDSSGAAVVLDESQQQAFLLTLNDLRLVLGVRLDIVEDNQEVGIDWEPDDPRLPLLAAYQWLTWLQSTLLEAMP